MLGRDGTDMHPFEYQTKLAAGRIVSLYALHVGRTYAGVMARNSRQQVQRPSNRTSAASNDSAVE
jgi:hypothetical protein